MAEHAALEMQAVTKTFGPVTALDDVSMRCEAGSVHALVGENGAGKSTLLGVLGGSTRPDAGKVLIDGEAVDPESYDPHEAHLRGVTIVHQELALVPSLSVVENIFLGRELGHRRLDRRGMRRRARQALDRLGADDIHETMLVERLSIAQAQLVEIARALVFETRVLALDEPSAVLAGAELEALFDVVRAVRDEGVAVIYVSHRLDEIFALADHYTVLKDGALAGSGDVADVSPDDLVRMMVGRDLADIFPPRAATRGAPALEVTGLEVAGTLHGVDLVAHRGEILGLAGLIGSGRTTLAKAVFGAVPVAGGRIRVGSQDGPFGDPRHAVAAGLSYIPEERKTEGLALDKSVTHNLTLLNTDDLRGRLGLLDPSRERAISAEAIERFSIRTEPNGRDPLSALSGGNQQKVVIAKWMLPNPDVLILDEPTRGIDIGAKQQIYRLLRQLADDGKCVVVISSELVEIIGLCDRVVVMAEGTITGELSGDAITEEAIMRLATPREMEQRT